MFGLDPYYSDEMSLNSNKVKVTTFPFCTWKIRFFSRFKHRSKGDDHFSRPKTNKIILSSILTFIETRRNREILNKRWYVRAQLSHLPSKERICNSKVICNSNLHSRSLVICFSIKKKMEQTMNSCQSFL